MDDTLLFISETRNPEMNIEMLKEKIATIKGSTFASLTTLTDVKLRGGKKNPMQGRVTKRVSGSNVMIFSNVSKNVYEAMVKRRMEKEGKDSSTFELKPRAWGTRIEGTPFVEHNEKTYLECFFISPGKSEYFLDGESIQKEEIEGLEETKTPSEESQGGIENKIIIRTYSADSIEKIKIKNETLE